MFFYQVSCECGFCSNICGSGMISRSPFEFTVPVYDPKLGKLLDCLFHESEVGLTGEPMVEWIEANGINVVRERYGDSVFALGLNPRSPEDLPCPKCGRDSARFTSAGF